MTTPKETSTEKFVHHNSFILSTDGSHRPEGNAACAWIVFSNKSQHIVKMGRKAYRGMTINQMELMAVNRALDHPGMDYIYIHTDSTYVMGCLGAWWRNWEKNNWINPATQQPIKNRELIEEILVKIKAKKYVSIKKIKAHTGDPFNSMVDRLATDLTYKMTQDASITDHEDHW